MTSRATYGGATINGKRKVRVQTFAPMAVGEANLIDALAPGKGAESV